MDCVSIARGSLGEQPDGRSGKGVVSWLVLGTWLVGTALAFWSLESTSHAAAAGATSSAVFESDVSPQVAEQWLRSQLVDRRALDEAEAPAKATVVHLSRAGCSCNGYAQPHVQKIEAQYSARGVRTLTAEQALPAWVKSTPAAMVFDATGKLVYYGPYDDPAWCGASADLTERALDSILTGRTSRPRPLHVLGCYCKS